jgi:holliday junction DNA helicase RuvA
MIAKLKGLLDSTGEDWAIIDVGGVGYQVFCSGRTLGALPGIGREVSLYIETQLREDSIKLFGFASEEERDWFSLLRGVQGVGSRLALALMSALSAGELADAMVAQDSKSLTRANGVGPKLAARIVNELKDKVGGLAGTRGAVVTALKVGAAGGPSSDAVSALVNLGYRQTEAYSAVAAVAKKLGPEADAAALIRGGLQELSRA